MTLVVTRKATAAADPGQGPLNDPSLREDDKPVPVTATHDLEFPCAGSGDDGLHLATLIACVGDDALDERKTLSSLPQQRLGPVSILHAGRMDTDGQEQAQRVGQDVALAAQDLLARVIAGRVKRGPPLTTPFALWRSMMAVVGLASRPSVSRTST